MPGGPDDTTERIMLSHDQGATLLRLVRDMRTPDRTMRPIDLLARHLDASNRLDELGCLLASGPMAELGPAPRLAAGDLTLEQLVAVKDASKRLMSSSEPGAQNLAGIAGYFLSVAAALAFHRTLISTRPLDLVQDSLSALIPVTGEPYAGLLEAALGVVDAEDGASRS